MQEGEVYTKAEAEGMKFEPSPDASGDAELELTIREGIEESTPEGTVLSSDEIIEREIEILSDINQDGETGIQLTQEVYSPNSHQNTNDSTPPADTTTGDPSTTPADTTTGDPSTTPTNSEPNGSAAEETAPAPAPAPANTQNHSNKRFAYTNNSEGVVIAQPSQWIKSR